MSSKVDIVNQALMILGAKPIISFEDETTEANAASILYEPAKKQLLRSFDWNCANKTAALALLAEPPVENTRYTSAWALPQDNLRILQVIQQGGTVYRQNEWEVQGNVLLTRTQSIIVRYIRNIVEPDMDVHVEMALAARVAMDMAYAITGDQSREAQTAQMFQQKLNEAMVTDAQERAHKNIQIDQFQFVRL